MGTRDDSEMLPSLNRLWRDARFAVRVLTRQPGFLISFLQSAAKRGQTRSAIEAWE